MSKLGYEERCCSMDIRKDEGPRRTGSMRDVELSSNSGKNTCRLNKELSVQILQED